MARNHVNKLWFVAFLRVVRLGPCCFLSTSMIFPTALKNCSFRIFADDTNICALSSNAAQLETLINQELTKVKERCDINRLAINFKKTNYMIIKSA